ncbi:AraC family transcriptional regulator [Paenibacillus doosanensis]|uniref:helix-turn-helix transcriptional regulator n=1 Tax=Paenibacillus doosanensis TaxID=1229154 RepID=UPI0021806B71|nr:AraC family transcriptional regulator [Paenibacillus doosanensis]MCS7463919.1 AraC family transcriptional regulator [Paenibacillus doosanensis]
MILLDHLVIFYNNTYQREGATRMNGYTPLEMKDEFHVHYKDLVIDQEEPLEHYHDAIEFALFAQADLQLFINGTPYDVKDGDVMLLMEYDVHRMLYKKGTRYRRFVVNFRKETVEPVLKSVHLESIVAVPDEQLSDMNRSPKCGKLRSASPEQREQLVSCLTLLMKLGQLPPSKEKEALLRMHTASLLLMFALLAPKPAAGRHRPSSSEVGRMIHYIDTHYGEPLDLQSVARHFHLSKYYVSHLFKRVTQLTVVEYIHRRRIAEAKLRLRTTNLSVLDISEECGFAHVQHFHRVFKKATGLTPYQYKKNLPAPSPDNPF